MILKKIISGGQTDADHAVLDAAIKFGIAYTGWIPKGKMTETGRLPAKYQLQEWESSGYSECIEQNVKAAKGTLLISYGQLSDDSNYARRMTLKHKHQLLGLDLNLTDASKASALVNDWIQLQRNDVLYVITPSIRTNLDAVKDTKRIIEGALLLDIMEASSGALHSGHSQDEYPEKLSSFPETVDEAVAQIVVDMPLQDRVKIANLKREDLEPVFMTLGIFVRNQLLHKGANKNLFDSCRIVAGNEKLSDIRASFVIIEKLWESLRGSHRLRIVK
jgi:hypothetical protein